jgi:hypothetical protein
MKRLKYYPSLTSAKGLVTEFNCETNGASFREKLDPEKVGYASPDFGFNNELIFD